jgi:hypothetical protein
VMISTAGDLSTRKSSISRKFGPLWEERYLAVPTTASLPEVLMSLLRAHLPALSPLCVGGGSRCS